MSEPPPKKDPVKDGLELPDPTLQQPRGDDGKFKPKEKKIPPSEPPAEPLKPKITEKTDPLLDQIEKDFWKSLKGKVEVKELEGVDQRTRIKMLRMLANSNIIKKSKEAVDPTQAPPPTPAPAIPTLMEQNLSDEYRADIRNKTSYLDVANQLRGKKK